MQPATGGRLFQLSRNVLLTHEDEPHSGALVASLSVPWGSRSGDDDDAGYHLVWPRDMTQSATALLAAGEIDLPLRALMFLSQAQFQNGRLPQNFFIDGRYFRNADQLDEYSFPILLAYHLSEAKALQGFDPKEMVYGAAGAIIIHGPMTQQERWEENEGYSPSTLASNIAALIVAADMARKKWSDPVTAQFLEEHADFLESNLEKWCVTNTGTLFPGISQYYIRMLPTNVKNGGGQPSLPENPDTASITIGNHEFPKPQPANSVIDGGFLELVRYGIRPANDPIIVNSVKVIDAILRKDFPGGPAYLRYNNDGYGQKANGDLYDGTGLGHPWPLLAGERGHYEMAAGGNAMPYVKALESFAGTRGLLPEQIWELPDLNTANPPLKQGGATGSSMPLAWAHAEYLKLARSVGDGKVFDQLAPVANRYLPHHNQSNLEIWNFDRQPLSIKAGRTFRLSLGGNFMLRWSKDNWTSFTDIPATATKVGVFYVDVPTQAAQTGGNLHFDIQWLPSQRWVGGNFSNQLTA
jgi:glucoamylase